MPPWQGLKIIKEKAIETIAEITLSVEVLLSFKLNPLNQDNRI